MDEIVELANAILKRTPLTEAQAKLYAALHVVKDGIAHGALVIDATLLDLLDQRVDNEPYVPVKANTPSAPVDELAALRKQMAEMQAFITSLKPAAAVNASAPAAPAPAAPAAAEPAPFVHGGAS